ncbi:hypothetical protein [Breoghania sp.]|uniref:hypothetical protein n=1 Tax=Breoghania sp. TaxID=2065378 RepID=UPI00262B5B40|nr:hypothetical protein [Breoghania sp.]MDJ0932134.1 hypothetical protein [Breoghania sp.]
MSLAVLLAAGVTGDAQARDGRCYALEDELARLSSITDDRCGGKKVHQWDRALQEAADRLDMLDQRARRAHCGGGFLFSSPDPRVCAGIDHDIADMHARMARLSRNLHAALRHEQDRPAHGQGARAAFRPAL